MINACDYRLMFFITFVVVVVTFFLSGDRVVLDECDRVRIVLVFIFYLLLVAVVAVGCVCGELFENNVDNRYIVTIYECW